MSIPEQNKKNQDTNSNTATTTKTTSTTSKSQEKQEQKPKHKVKGKAYHYYVESILLDDVPYFLSINLKTGKIETLQSIPTTINILEPLDANQCGYIPYSFTSEELHSLITREISKQEILDDIRNQVEIYIVVDENGKYLIIIDTVLTYCLEWIHTIHYPFFVGDTESGKSSALHLARWLCYRCHLGEDIPMADIYNFLGTDEEGCGTIAEDEAQGIYKDREKIRMYKSSYTKGSRKARILNTNGPNKHQVYYHTFCPKWFGGEQIPLDKGFTERLVQVHMISGTPKSNIKRLTDEEKIRLNHLRNKLLVWKMQNITKGLQRFNSGLVQRDQELWEDFLSVAHGTTYFEKAKEVVKFYTEQRHQKISDSLEGRIFKIIVKLLDDNLEIMAQDLWHTIAQGSEELPGQLDPRQTKSFYPDEFGFKVTMNMLAIMMEEKFHARKKVRVENYQRKTYYVFDKDKIKILATKYNVQLNLN